MLTYRRKNGQQKYRMRSTVTCSVEWELYQRVKDLAETNRYTISEIVAEAFIKFIKDNEPPKPPPSMSF